jgi:hypothetical protein
MLAAAIEKLIRHSGAFAKERVAKFLKRGGPDAVLAAIDRLDDSSYVRRVYYTELLQQAPVSEALLGRVLQRVPAELKSDYDKATLLTHAAQLPAMNDTHRVAIARAVQSIGSDYDQRRTLVAILNTRPLASAVAAAVLDATESIGSSHDRSQVLRAVVESGGFTPATAQPFTTRISNMSSHDHSTTLINLIERGGLTDATADTFFGSAAGIPSSHDLSRTLLKVLERPDLSGRILEGVLRTVIRVGSSHDRATVLLSVANRGRLSPEARKLYIAASRDLGTHDENRVLAALVKAEGR